MKKLLILSILSLSLITVSCKSLPKNEIVLPPKPKREYIGKIGGIADYALVINYYEHLVQEWELWGDEVSAIIGE